MTHEQIAEQAIAEANNDFLGLHSYERLKNAIVAALQSATAEGAQERKALCARAEAAEADWQAAEAKLATIRADTLTEERAWWSEHFYDCFRCQQRGICEDAEARARALTPEPQRQEGKCPKCGRAPVLSEAGLLWVCDHGKSEPQSSVRIWLCECGGRNYDDGSKYCWKCGAPEPQPQEGK